jgi:hypothetical protein
MAEKLESEVVLIAEKLELEVDKEVIELDGKDVDTMIKVRGEVTLTLSLSTCVDEGSSDRVSEAELGSVLVNGKSVDCPVCPQTGVCGNIDGVNEGRAGSLELRKRLKFPCE